MPFYLSLKPQETEITLPAVWIEKIQEAQSRAHEVLKSYPGLKYVGIFYKDDITPPRLISNVIQKQYKQYTWTQYKMFERFNRIDKFFVLNGDHYIKLKECETENQTTCINIKVTIDEKNEIFEIAKNKKLTVSDYIRNLIKNDKI